MGDAKRRAETVGGIGRAARYCVWIWWKDEGHLCRSRIPFYVKADRRTWEGDFHFIHETNLRAVGNLGLILAILRYPENPAYQKAIAESLGEESALQIREWAEAQNLPQEFDVELHGRLINIDNQMCGATDYPHMKGYKEGVGIGPGEEEANIQAMHDYALGRGKNGKTQQREETAGGGGAGEELDTLARDLLAITKSPVQKDVSGLLRGAGIQPDRSRGDGKGGRGANVQPGVAIMLPS